MNGIFAYAGKGECKRILLNGIRGMKSKGSELAGIAILKGEGFATAKLKGTPAELYEKAESVEGGACIGICECADAVRLRASGVTAPPSVSGDYAAVLDSGIESYDALKSWCRGKLPVASDEDLLLALLSLVNGDNMLEVMKRIIPSFQRELGFAFISSNEEAVYARAGDTPFFVGFTDDGIVLANEAMPVLSISRKFFVIENGECVRITRDRAVAFDSRGRRIKKPLRASPAVQPDRLSAADGKELFGIPRSARETLSGIIKSSTIDFSGLHLTRRSLERFKRVIITGCGSYYYASRLAAYMLEALADLPCTAFTAGELISSGAYFDSSTLLIAVSESGEERDIFKSISLAGEFDSKSILFTLQPYSLCAMAADMTVDWGGSGEGDCPFISCALSLCLFSVWAGNRVSSVSELYFSVAAKLAELLPGKLASAIKSTPELESAARALLSAEELYISGCAADSAAAMEGARKIRSELGINAVSTELSQLLCESPKCLPYSLFVVIISSREQLKSALYHLQRLKARGGDIIIITTANLEADITGFDRVITVTESLPVFDSLTCLASLYKTVDLAAEIMKKEEEQQAS